MRTKIAVVSDLHLGVHQNSEKWLKEALKFAKWFRDDLDKRGVNEIIIPGDIFHDRTDINLLTIQYAAQIFEEWKDFRIWIIPGNHDCFFKDNADVTSISIFKLYPNITVFGKTETLIKNKRTIQFVPWGCNVDPTAKSDVIVGHFELNGFKMNSFKVCEGHQDCDHILDVGSIVLTGHFHLRQEMRTKKGLVLYVGTPYEMDYNDIGSEKGYHILDLNDLSIERVVYTLTTKHKRLTLSNIILNKTTLNEYLEQEVRGNVVTFIVDKEIDFDKVNALVQKIQMYEPLAFKGTEILKKEQSAVVTENVESNVQVEQLINEFVEQMELENSDEVLKLVLELYSKYKAA